MQFKKWRNVTVAIDFYPPYARKYNNEFTSVRKRLGDHSGGFHRQRNHSRIKKERAAGHGAAVLFTAGSCGGGVHQ